MGLPPFYQNAGLDWLRGFPFPPPPQSWWLALHSEARVTSINQVGARLLLNRDEWSTARPASRAPLPQDPWVPGDGELLEITNFTAIFTEPQAQDADFLGFSLWTEAVDGDFLLTGVLQEPAHVLAGDVLTFEPGHLLLRFTAP